MEQRVRLEVRDRIAYVTMNRPDKMNGLDFPMFDALVATAKQIRADRSIRVVILRGEGRAFCAGLDFGAVLKERPKMMRSFFKWGVKKTNLYQDAGWCWRQLPVPVIAVVHGACFGGGLQIALGADFRIAAPDAQLSVMEAKWGLIPDMSGSVSLRELLPMDLAKRLTMTAEVFDGRKALEYGLVTEVADDPLAAAEALARQLLARSPDALVATKQLFHRSWVASERWAFRIESALQLRLLLGRNHREALRAGRAGEGANYRDRTLG
ncbi:MAG TPA: crotonase/enoyl-CoA hydratase family protein [Solimonas sp.]|nr:crotonase/enoyl-CoA hydratase family protein [Solimonas sp.]